MAYSDDDWPQGTQTLGRGMSIIAAIGTGTETLSALAREIGCTRSTTQRLTSALLRHGWLRQAASGRYGLGDRLASLGDRAQTSVPLPALSRPVLRKLLEATRDNVHLAIRSGDQTVYLTKLSMERDPSVASRPASTMSGATTAARTALARTGIGRALLLDDGNGEWARLYRLAYRSDPGGCARWLDAMEQFRRSGCVCNPDDGVAGKYCVAAPVRDAGGAIVAAISVSGVPQSMSAIRMTTLAHRVRHAAEEISERLGWDRNEGGVVRDVAD